MKLLKGPRKRAEPCVDEHPHWHKVRDHFVNNVRLWASAVGAVVVLGGYMITTWSWLKDQVDSFHTDAEAAIEYKKLRDEAQIEYSKLRAEIDQRVTKINSDLQAAAARVERKQLWSTVGQIRLEALILRNRVNECNERKLQTAACEQYKDELKETQDRFNEARKIAVEASK